MNARGEGRTAATRVRMEREKRGWTLDITAEKLRSASIPRASASMVNKVELGHRAISLEELAAYADVFQLGIADILTEPSDYLRDIVRRYTDAIERFSVAFEQLSEVVIEADDALGNVGGDRLMDGLSALLVPFNEVTGIFNDKFMRALTIQEKKR